MKLLSKMATCNSHGQDSSYFLGWQEYEKNPYDEIQNPKGIIQMGLAENQVNNFFQHSHFFLSDFIKHSSFFFKNIL